LFIVAPAAPKSRPAGICDSNVTNFGYQIVNDTMPMAVAMAPGSGGIVGAMSLT
jgi:hypothetical protein